MVVGDDNATGEDVVVGMGRCHRGTLLGAEFVDLRSMDAVIELVDDFHRKRRVVDFEILDTGDTFLADFL